MTRRFRVRLFTYANHAIFTSSNVALRVEGILHACSTYAGAAEAEWHSFPTGAIGFVLLLERVPLCDFVDLLKTKPEPLIASKCSLPPPSKVWAPGHLSRIDLAGEE